MRLLLTVYNYPHVVMCLDRLSLGVRAHLPRDVEHLHCKQSQRLAQVYRVDIMRDVLNHEIGIRST